MKISKRGSWNISKIHEIYETFKLENFIPHLYPNRVYTLLQHSAGRPHFSNYPVWLYALANL